MPGLPITREHPSWKCRRPLRPRRGGGADGDAEELRVVFTHIDSADPQRQFIIGVFVEEDDTYAGAQCCAN